jgi:hypothetical protein
MGNRENKYLTFAEWLPYIPLLPDVDAVDRAYFWDNREQQIHHRINAVNELYDKMIQVWPDGTALDFYIALELEQNTDWDVLDSLQDPAFVFRVLQEAELRGIKHSKPLLAAPIQAKPQFRIEGPEQSDPSSDSDDAYEEKPVIERSWTSSQIAKMEKVLRRLASNPSRSWGLVAKEFPDRTADQCKACYHKYHSTGKITADFDADTPAEFARKQVPMLVGIEFRYVDLTSYVGFEKSKLKAARLQNPLVNYIDQLTGKNILFAAMSPDGYVLDYYTWVECLKKERCNPFTRRPMFLRDLVMVTFDNIEELIGRIENLEQSRPAHPEDDHLAARFASKMRVKRDGDCE